MKRRIPAPQAAYHVSPAGNDSDLRTAERPFRTIERARDAVGQVNRNMTGTINAVCGGGTYAVERVLLSGGRRIEASGDAVHRTSSGSPGGHHGARPLNSNNRAQNRIASCPVHVSRTETAPALRTSRRVSRCGGRRVGPKGAVVWKARGRGRAVEAAR